LGKEDREIIQCVYSEKEYMEPENRLCIGEGVAKVWLEISITG
jgi:hypothetical protein